MSCPSDAINTLIANRKLYTGFDEATYHRPALFSLCVKNHRDPNLLFKVKIFGYYKRIYKWSDDECQRFIDQNLSESQGHTVNGVWYAYDWGTGYNKITKDRMHEPTLDHIIPKERGGDNSPENMRIRCRRLNENKGNTHSDQERFATIVDMFDDIESPDVRHAIIELLQKRLVDQ